MDTTTALVQEEKIPPPSPKEDEGDDWQELMGKDLLFKVRKNSLENTTVSLSLETNFYSAFGKSNHHRAVSPPYLPQHLSSPVLLFILVLVRHFILHHQTRGPQQQQQLGFNIKTRS
jgi:hypothetical protein